MSIFCLRRHCTLIRFSFFQNNKEHFLNESLVFITCLFIVLYYPKRLVLVLNYRLIFRSFLKNDLPNSE